MSVLDIKLLRDVRRLWAQSLAIALVVAGGVASLVMAVGSFNSLEETRIMKDFSSPTSSPWRSAPPRRC